MATKTPNMQLLGETLTRQYRLACELYNTYPIGRYTHQFSQGNLYISLPAIDHDHLEAVCHVLQNKITPLTVKIDIPSSKEVGVRLIQQAIRGVSLCVAMSHSLTTLELYNIGLKGNNLDIFCQGLAKSRNIKTLSITACSLRDIGVERLCQSIKNVPSISHLSLIDCQMSEKGASIVAGLLKHQRLNRDSAMWQETLRLRHPHLDGMRGLRRVTLNYNPQIGDEGAATIAESLLEDLWIKAVDLQHCGIGADGGLTLRKVLEANHTLEVLDIRKNPFIPDHVVNEVMNHLHDRHDEYNMGTKYEWLDPCDDPNIPKEDTRKPGLSREPGVLIRRVMKEQTNENSKDLQTSSNRPAPPTKPGIPWRVEHRLYERREGLKPGSVVDSFLDSKITTLVPTENSDVDEKKSADFRKIKKLLHQYKKMYRKERVLRKRAERKLSQLQTKLNRGNFLDDGTVEHIETCFKKFQTFLINLKAAGFHWQSELWDFVADTAEVDMVDIANPLHGPRLSSFVNQSINRISDEKRLQNGEQSQIKQSNGIVPGNIELFPSSRANIPVIMRNLSIQEAQLYVHHNDIVSHEHEEEGSKFSLEPENSNFLPFSHTSRSKISDHLAENGMHHEGTREMGNADCYRGKNLLSEYSTVDHNKTNNRIESKSTDTVVTTMHTSDKNINKDSEDFDARAVNEIILCGTIVSNIKGKEAASEEVAGISGEIEVLSVNQSTKYFNAENHSQVPMEKDLIDNSQDVNVNLQENVVDEGSQVYSGSSSSEPPSVDEAEKVNSNKTESRLSPNDFKKGEELTDSEQSNESNSKENPPSFLEIVQMPMHTENSNKFLGDTNYDDIILAVDNSRSETPGVDSYTHRSETDDEKLQMQRAFMQLVGKRSGSVSSVSITEQLSQSHSDWVALGSSKPRKYRDSSRDKSSKINIDKIQELGKLNSKSVKNDKPNHVAKGMIDYDSDFEVSDVEGLSISASSLTSTTIPDDLVTPGEEEF